MALVDPPKFQQRFSVRNILPPWLNEEGGFAQRYIYTIELMLDGLLEKMFEAQMAKCPIPGEDASYIPLQADDRLLVQGPAESNAAFINRLGEAFEAWSTAGSRSAILAQLQAYLTNLQPGVAASLPEMTIVGGNATTSTWDTIYGYTPVGAPPAHRAVTPANWDWDGQTRTTRAWLIMYMHLVATGQAGTLARIDSIGGSGVDGVTSGFANISGLVGMSDSNIQQYLTITNAFAAGNRGTFQIVDVLSETSCIIANPTAVLPETFNGDLEWSIGGYPYIAPAPVWGSPQFVWGQDSTWGVSCSPYVIQSIRQILARWKSAGTYYPNIIVSFLNNSGIVGSEFSPLSGIGTGNPDGTWGGIGKNVDGCWVPAKTSSAVWSGTAFCDGTGLAIQCYEQNFT